MNWNAKRKRKEQLVKTRNLNKETPNVPVITYSRILLRICSFKYYLVKKTVITAFLHKYFSKYLFLQLQFQISWHADILMGFFLLWFHYPRKIKPNRSLLTPKAFRTIMLTYLLVDKSNHSLNITRTPFLIENIVPLYCVPIFTKNSFKTHASFPTMRKARKQESLIIII